MLVRLEKSVGLCERAQGALDKRWLFLQRFIRHDETRYEVYVFVADRCEQIELIPIPGDEHSGRRENRDMYWTRDLRLKLGRHVAGYDAGDLFRGIGASLSKHVKAGELLTATDGGHRHGFAFEIIEGL